MCHQSLKECSKQADAHITQPHIPINISLQLQYPFPFGLFPSPFSLLFNSFCLHQTQNNPLSLSLFIFLHYSPKHFSLGFCCNFVIMESFKRLLDNPPKLVAKTITPISYMYTPHTHTHHARERERMGRQNKDPSIVGSSIVLLQERFKQLQRLKEMREERQILKPLSPPLDPHDLSATNLSTTTSYGSAYQLQDPLALGLNSTSHHHTPHFRAMNPQQFPAVRGPHHSLFEIHDVDTSLRL